MLQVLLLLLGVSIICTPAIAEVQINPFTGRLDSVGADEVGAGTTGKLAVYTSTTEVGPSANIVENGGNVGIGTLIPDAKLKIAAGTSSVAPFKLTTQSVGLTTVQQGALELIGNSLQFTQLVKRRGVAMSQTTRTSSTTVSNTTTESAALITAEHGANYLEVGKMEEIRLYGTLQQTVVGNGTLSIRTKYAGATILTTTTSSGNIAAGTPFEIIITTTCRSVGASGTMQINSRLFIDGVTNNPDAQSLVTIDTTTAQNTTVTAQWSVADASNNLTVHQGRVLCIEPNK